MSEHGFLSPNPALFDLENRKKKPGLAHELGEGAKCTQCGDSCSGFQLHYWRKVCMNCRCGKAEHNVLEEHDPGFHFVGKLFDRPLRTKAEERKFVYGDVFEDTADTSKAKREIKLDWVPPGVTSDLATKYLRSIPEQYISIEGSEGAQRRKKQLEKQFPIHDVEPGNCHELTTSEIDTMNSYVENVRLNVVGQGMVQELGHSQQEPSSDFILAYKGEDEAAYHNLPPPPLPSSLPPPPPELLYPPDSLAYSLERSHLGGKTGPPVHPKPPGTYHATPYLPSSPTKHSSSSSSSTYNSSATPYSPPAYLTSPQPYKFPGSTGSSIASSSPSPPHTSPIPPQHGGGGGAGAAGGGGGGGLGQHHYNPAAAVAAGQPREVAASQYPGHAGQGQSWACSGCGGAMFPGEVAIFAERAGNNKCWHPGCFSCVRCGDMLEDLLYFYAKGQLYCGRDFADIMNIPRCAACDELIFAAEYTGAEERFWHLKHFCCYECDTPLAGHKYIPVSGQPHCLTCWQNKHGKVCSSCEEYIHPEDQRISLGEDHWHAQAACFKCGVCSKSLVGGKMSRKNGTLLCSSVCARQLSEQLQQQLRQQQLEDPHRQPQPYLFNKVDLPILKKGGGGNGNNSSHSSSQQQQQQQYQQRSSNSSFSSNHSDSSSGSELGSRASGSYHHHHERAGADLPVWRPLLHANQQQRQQGAPAGQHSQASPPPAGQHHITHPPVELMVQPPSTNGGAGTGGRHHVGQHPPDYAKVSRPPKRQETSSSSSSSVNDARQDVYTAVKYDVVVPPSSSTSSSSSSVLSSGSGRRTEAKSTAANSGGGTKGPRTSSSGRHVQFAADMIFHAAADTSDQNDNSPSVKNHNSSNSYISSSYTNSSSSSSSGHAMVSDRGYSMPNHSAGGRYPVDSSLAGQTHSPLHSRESSYSTIV